VINRRPFTFHGFRQLRQDYRSQRRLDWAALLFLEGILHYQQQPHAWKSKYTLQKKIDFSAATKSSHSIVNADNSTCKNDDATPPVRRLTHSAHSQATNNDAAMPKHTMKPKQRNKDKRPPPPGMSFFEYCDAIYWQNKTIDESEEVKECLAKSLRSREFCSNKRK
jgi:hypothetical protein